MASGELRIAPAPDTYYPEEDDEPMVQTDVHMMAVLYLRTALEVRYVDQPNICLTADVFLYYDANDNRLRKAPDIMVIKGVPKLPRRRTFRVWEEQTVPSTIFEILSDQTWHEDLEVKPLVYAALGVKEYFLFDPDGQHLDPPLQGFRLEEGVYQPITPEADGSLISRELGLRLLAGEGRLRLFDLDTGEELLTPEELDAQVRSAATDAAEQAEGRQRAEAEAERERNAREQAQQQAEHERHAREAAERRAAELAAELARLRGQESK